MRRVGAGSASPGSLRSPPRERTHVVAGRVGETAQALLRHLLTRIKEFEILDT